MEGPAFWRDLQAQFHALYSPTDDMRAVFSSEEGWTAPYGGSDRVRGQFEALAVRGAVAWGTTAEKALGAWLDRLRRDTPAHFLRMSGNGYHHATIPRSSIVRPKDSHKSTASEEPVVERHGAEYVLVAGRLGRGEADVRCRVDHSDPDGGILQHLCLASANLCTLLETEAFVAERTQAAGDIGQPAAVLTQHPPAPIPSSIAPAPATTEGQRQVTGIFRREGKMWRVGLGSEQVVLQHRQGMDMIQRLLAAREQDFSAEALLGRDRRDDLHLENLSHQKKPAKATRTDVDTRALGGALKERGSDALDGKTLKEIGAVRDLLDRQLSKAEREGDPEEILAVKEKLESLDQWKSKDTFRGRSRQVGSPAVRAAKAAGARYARTLSYLLACGAKELHAHVRESIKHEKGIFEYKPVNFVNWLT
jgi:hypothetical protein